MRLSLRFKTITGVASIAALLLLVLIITVFQLLNDLVDNNVQKSADTNVALFVSTTKNAFLSYDLASLDADVSEILTNPNISYVKVKDKLGNVFVGKGNQQALNRPFDADDSVSEADDGIYDTRAPIMVNNSLYGYVEIGLNIASVTESVSRVKNWTLTLALMEFILVGLCSYILGSYLMSQLRQLHQGAKHLGDAVKNNDYREVFVPVRGNDELSELAEAFNQLVERLKEEHEQRQRAQDELKELNTLLEEKVQDRTALLHQKNFQLEEANKDLKETQVQLLQAEKMASVGQLAAGVAHEINNPVGFVSSNISTLSEYVATYQMVFSQINVVLAAENEQARLKALTELKSMLANQDMAFINEDIAELLTDSREGLHRVAEIVKGLKLFSRVDSDQMQQHNINDCVRTTLAMVNNQLKYICTVETHLGRVPDIPMNVGKVSQVVTNLLINAGQAIEATGKNGKVIITTCTLNGFVELRVEDSGCGIPPSHLDKLFNPFFTTKPEGQGTGLGLSISFGIAQEHGGTLSASSVEGEGSTFTLALPVEPAPSVPLMDKESE
ncbi:histidine kinase [Alteromonas mediterranea]|uniref:HAMP domain-containing sensor histidine kinase n=1 Tax=Alteromonas mediterranea TaxID=314275 RepID=UPI000903CC87|nr:ATP-binding protein [Alteromonas mediterranea]APD95437.1 histidine kinase [Alteromonas mediterranea]APD99071.1 histidine kinase [Alteromonas mediterranea]QDG36316.1 HAMP domain-containing sensor histidine kinase [Alteromonas mediterranea]